jgi:hypothetical protein
MTQSLLALLPLLPWLVLVAGCDPFATGHFVVVPESRSNATPVEVASLVSTIATRHGMQTLAPDSTCSLGQYLLKQSISLTLSLCVSGSSGSVQVGMAEFRTRIWSFKANRVWQDIEEMLRNRFGSTVHIYPNKRD